MKYIVRFYKKDYYYIYLISKENKEKFLTFSSFLSYIEANNINFKDIRFHMNLDDLFFHFVEYQSVKRVTSYTNLQEEKKKMLRKEDIL